MENDIKADRDGKVTAIKVSKGESILEGTDLNDDSLGMDTDISITTREFIRWIQEENLDFNAIEDSKFDDLIGMETGASIIFGNTGGVMEAAMRTAYKLITDKEPPPYALTHLEDVRGMEGVKEATVQLGDDVTLSVAVVHGGKNTRDFSYRKFLFNYSAFPIEPKISIFSFTVALIASAPGANNLRGSNPFPSKSLPASIYLRVASAKEI